MQNTNHGYRRFHFKQPSEMPIQRYSGGGVGQYQQYNNGPGNINDTFELPTNSEEPHEAFNQPWDTGLQPPEFPPANTGNDPIYPNDPSPAATPPPGYSGGTPLELINDLGYDPSHPYGGSGSGVPTQKFGGMGGSLAGSAIGSLLFPGIGTMLGGKLGAIGGRMLTRWLQQQHFGQGGQPGQPGQDPQSSAVGSGSYPPGYLAKWYGKGQGGEFGRQGDPSTPASFGNNASNWGSNTNSFIGGGGNPNLPTGGSYFGSSGGPGSLMTPGGQSAISGAPGGMLGDFGAKLALHSGSFLNAIKGMGYNNLHQFQNQTGFNLNTPQGGGQGVGGGQLPMKQNYAGGGVAGMSDPTELQGRDHEGGPMSPDEMALLYRQLMAEAEEKRREAMNEKRPMPHGTFNFAGGGRVRPTANPLQGMGTDTVPAALTPGEVVLNKSQQSAVMPRPGMKGRLRPDQMAAIAEAMRRKHAVGM